MCNKKLLISIYYDDAANYFISLEKELIRRKIEPIYICHNLSSFLKVKKDSKFKAYYMKNLSFRFSVIRKRLFSPKVQNIFLPEYYMSLAKSRKELIDYSCEFEATKEKLNSILETEQSAILTGEDRFVEYIIKNRVERSIFFEQGPFNTTSFCKNGVNANIVKNKKMLKYFPRDIFDDNFYLERKDKISRSSIYRLSDFLQRVFYRFLFLELPSEKNDIKEFKTKIKKYWVRNNSVNSEENNVEGKFTILVVLQVKLDANNILHTPAFNLEEFLRNLVNSDSIQGIANIVVRPHPLEDVSELELIRNWASNIGGSISNDALNKDLDNADIVVTSNSTVGIEAYLQGLPVIAFGHSYWDKLPGIICARSPDDAAVIISNWSNHKAFYKKIDKHKVVCDFLRDHFVPGHYRFGGIAVNEIGSFLEDELKS